MSKSTPFSRWVELAGSEKEPASGANVADQTQANETFEVSVRLRRRNPLPAMTPGPRRHMTHAEYAANHGADDADIMKVEAFARHFNLNIQAALPVERTVLLKGNAEDFSKAFGVKLYTHRFPNGHTYRGRVGTISIPSELEGAVVGVFGLDNRRVAWPNVRFTQRTAAQAARTADASPAAQFQTPGPTEAFFANQLAKLYNFPADVDGTGQTIGLVELGGGFRQQDLEHLLQAGRRGEATRNRGGESDRRRHQHTRSRGTRSARYRSLARHGGRRIGCSRRQDGRVLR